METSQLEELICQVLPSLDEATVQSLAGKLSSIGIETEEDLSLIEEHDITPIIKPIQARKLLRAWKQKGKTRFISYR